MTSHVASRTGGSRWRAAPAVGVVLLAALTGIAVCRQQCVRHQPAVVSRVAPRPAVSVCAECHSDITDAFAHAPHARTLHQAAEPEVLAAFEGRTFQRPDAGASFRYERRGDRLILSTSAYARELPIDWVFGSGTHARTPLLTWTDADGNTAGIEHSVSWYPDGGLGVTFGQEAVHDQSGVHALGHPRSPAEVINCFGCHATFVPTEQQRIDLDGVEPGVGCVRCHWNTEDHVRAMADGSDTTIERFSQFTPREAVDRCGECHRRADEMGGPITADNRTIVRFAPVGLVQSACFLRQDEVRPADGSTLRLDCTSCHNPHRASVRDWRAHAAVCLACHDADRHLARDCSVAARQDNCLDCHMPKVPMSAQLSFTDHWIRVRTAPPPAESSTP